MNYPRWNCNHDYKCVNSKQKHFDHIIDILRLKLFFGLLGKTLDSTIQTSEQFQQIKKTESRLIQRSLCGSISYTATAEKILTEQIEQHLVWHLLVRLSYRKTESEKFQGGMTLYLYNQFRRTVTKIIRKYKFAISFFDKI